MLIADVVGACVPASDDARTDSPTCDRTALARLFRGLGDPTRRRIIEVLDGTELSVSEIVDAVGAPQPRVSTHLACLRHCGLAENERRGRVVVYRLSVPGLPQLLRSGASVAAPRADHLATCQRIGPSWA
jgi:ArsR family transcriptional regulator, cadmium/lead-responsive transcriptional repressor